MKKQVTVCLSDGFKLPFGLHKFLFLLLFALSSIQAIAQTATVTGTVLDDKKEPVIGATVEVIDAMKKNIGGTVTDIDGNYSIEVKDVNMSSLKFSFLGNKSQTIELKGQTSGVNAVLSEDAAVLDEVVAMGYVNQTKPEITGSVSSIPEKDIKLTMNGSLETAMQGRSTGVQVTNQSGAPGAASSVRIRGVGSTNGGEPLYVIDGVPVGADALNLLNPSDIQTMDILKDASATAIYGTRAANGVVMITTKKGKEGKMAVNFDASFGMQQVWKQIDMLNGEKYKQYQRDVYTNSGEAVPFAFNNPNNPYINNNINWQDKIFQNGFTKNYNLNLSGGSEKVLYSVSGGVYNQTGTLVGTEFNRYSLRINTEAKPKKWLTLGQNLSLSNANNTGNTSQNIRIREGISTSPLLPVRDETGAYAASDSSRTGFYGGLPQLAFNDSRKINNNTYRILGNVYTEVAIFKKLKYKINLGLDYLNSADVSVAVPYKLGYSSSFGQVPTVKTVNDNREYRISPLLDNTLYFSDTIAKKHVYGVLVGTSLQSFYNSSVNTLNSSNPASIDVISYAGKGIVTGGRNDINALRGYFGRVTYNYANKYLFTANARYDGSSKFPVESRYALFPSFSAGWRLMEENFMKNIGFVNAYFSDIKVRVGWGQTGNQEGIGNNVNLLLFNDKPKDPFGGTTGGGTGAIAPAGLPNYNAKWETVEQTNIGLDLSLFKNKLSFVVDYFKKTSKDMIIQIPILYSSGLKPEGGLPPTYWGNAGSLENKGLEMALTYTKADGDFHYSVTGNVSFVTNKITKLGESDAPLLTTLTTTQVGSAVGSYFGYQMDGIFQEGEVPTYRIDGTSGFAPKAGDVKFRDINNDGILNAQDRVVLGNSIPKMIYGFTANADYMGFDLRLFFQGVYGNKLYNQFRSELEGMTNTGPTGGNQMESVADRWTPTNPSNTMPRAIFGDPAKNSNPSSRWVESGSFLRLKTVQFGYTLPTKMLTNLTRATGTDVGLRIYFSAFNLLTITKYTGLDPEVSGDFKQNTNVPDPLSAGVDRGVYPQAKSYTIGLQLNF